MKPPDIWREFLARLEQAPLPLASIRPYPSLENLRETLQSNLNDHLRRPLLTAAASGKQPEWFVTGDQVHFIFPIGADDDAVDFCLSFLVEGDHWYFQHMENIFLRIDQIGALPTSRFPDLPGETKAWTRDEFRVTDMVRLYTILATEKGKAFALDCFCDGQEYFTGAQAWLPFLPKPQAFILYACWDLANLQENPVTLIALDETKAIIQAKLRYFTLYQRAGHLPNQIAYEDYFRLFESIWLDRAAQAGWSLEMAVNGDEVRFAFSRETGIAK